MKGVSVLASQKKCRPGFLYQTQGGKEKNNG